MAANTFGGTRAVLIYSESGTLRVEKAYFLTRKVPLFVCKVAVLQNCKTPLTMPDFTSHFFCTFTEYVYTIFILFLKSFTTFVNAS